MALMTTTTIAITMTMLLRHDGIEESCAGCRVMRIPAPAEDDLHTSA